MSLAPGQFAEWFANLEKRIARLEAKIAAGDRSPETQAKLDEARAKHDKAVAAIVAAMGGSPATAPVGPFTVEDAKWGKDYGIYYADTQGGGTFEKRNLRNHRRDNVRLMAWDSAKGAQPVIEPVTVRDLVLEGASAATPQSLDGTAESNLWAGMTGYYSRIKGSKAAWMGGWTGGHSANPLGGCTHSTFEDMEFSDTYVGLYVELVTRFCEFKRIWTHDTYGPALKIEWAQVTGPARTRLVSHDLLFDGCVWDVRAKRPTGYWRDICDIDVQSGSYGITIQNSTLITGGRKPIINFPTAIDDPSKPNKLINVRDEFGNMLQPTYDTFAPAP